MFLVCLTFHYCGVLSESMWGIHYAPTVLFYQKSIFFGSEKGRRLCWNSTVPAGGGKCSVPLPIKHEDK